MRIKPIETVYKGYRFRSRLEARWAIFFDKCGIEYEYEKEGYDLGCIWYLPDFWIPKMNSFFEIKPAGKPTDKEIQKITLLARMTGYEAFIIAGPPWVEINSSCIEHSEYIIYDGVSFDGELTKCVFVQCRDERCNNIFMEEVSLHCMDMPICTGGRQTSCCSEKWGYSTTPILINAYLAARQARFERGVESAGVA